MHMVVLDALVLQELFKSLLVPNTQKQQLKYAYWDGNLPSYTLEMKIHVNYVPRVTEIAENLSGYFTR